MDKLPEQELVEALVRIEELEATVAELKKDRDIALDYISAVGQAQESLERIAELEATIAELNQAAEEDYNRNEDALVKLEAENKALKEAMSGWADNWR